MNGCADVILALLAAGVDVNMKSQNGVSFFFFNIYPIIIFFFFNNLI